VGFLIRVCPCLLALACVPEFDGDPSLVERPRVLALSSTPAEAAPGETVTLHALIASPTGTLQETPLGWALCLARRPLAELGPIAPSCLDDEDEVDEAVIESLGFAATLDAELPGDACRLFGPEPPATMPGEPTGRPVEPDATGGYFQPVLARLYDDESSLELLKVRIACGLAGATQAQAAEYARRYTRNVAPEVLELGLDDGSISVEPGEHVQLRAAWADCPREPECGDGLCSLDEQHECMQDCVSSPGCGGAETHVFFDPIDLAVEVRREAISVAWFASAGSFDDPRTGTGSDELESSSRNGWTAPLEPQIVHAWVVLRDDRGGVAWADLDLRVEP
jgi:hypothetical protein